MSVVSITNYVKMRHDTEEADIRTASLIAARMGGTITAGENDELERWLAGSPRNRALYDRLTDPEYAGGRLEEYGDVDIDRISRKITERIVANGNGRTARLRKWRRIAAAVAIPLLAAATIWFFADTVRQPEVAEILPGTHKAMLEVGDGLVVDLAMGEEMVIEGAVLQNHDEYLSYKETATDHVLQYNTLIIPRGGEYGVELSDGTRVWLNSDSRLRYPQRFEGDEREVWIEGEGYFDVAHAAEPFIVHTRDYEIAVTGTEFNVRSYNAGQTEATLMDGSVDIHFEGSVTGIVPGQQAVIGQNGIAVREAGDGVTAWREGVFRFSQRRLEQVLDDLARWYDLEVVYEDETMRSYHLSARFSRSAPIEDVLEILEMTRKVNFNLRGRTLTVAAAGDI